MDQYLERFFQDSHIWHLKKICTLKPDVSATNQYSWKPEIPAIFNFNHR